MSGATIRYAFADAGFAKGVAQLRADMRSKLPKQIGAALVETTQARFDAGREPLGAAWTPLSPAYAQIKRGSKILVASGLTQRSITSQVSGAVIAVGTNRIQARVHQFGAVIKPVSAPALVFKLGGVGPRGGRSKRNQVLVFARSVRIPQRPFLGFGPTDQRAVMEVVSGAIARQIG